MQETQKVNSSDLHRLLGRVKTGDREAFMTLTKTYQKNVFYMAFSFSHNREDALDIVQETFLRLYQKIHLFREDMNFKNWLLQLTKNLCIDHYRKYTKRHIQMAAEKRVEDMNLSSEKNGDRIRETELSDAVHSCLERLSERQRMVFVMKHYNNMKYREIAEILNIALGTVKSLHSKAVRNLRVLMSPYEWGAR